MSAVISKDGTSIAYERIGSGPAVITVNGALVYRAFWGDGPLAALLADQFTVYTYDRRGRGESGDTQPYAVEREVEDLDALIDQAGGTAYLYGSSSGAALVLEAAVRLGKKVKKIALYEPPYNTDSAAMHSWQKYTQALDERLKTGDRAGAVGLFMILTGAAEEQVDEMRGSPEFAQFEAVAPTLYYDAAALGLETAAVPYEKASRIEVPALVINGAASYAFMGETAKTLAAAFPHGRHVTLEGQTHEVANEVLTPVLKDFFAERAGGE